MNDIAISAHAIPGERIDLQAHYAQVRSYQSERVRSVVRINKLMAATAIISLAANLALAGTLAIALPLKSIVPLPILVHDDGTLDTAVSWSDMSVAKRQVAIRQAVWAYVRHREGYNFGGAKYAYDLVALMSSPDVRAGYEQWFLAKFNPDSVQLKIGKRGQVDLEEIGISWVSERVALVRYWRTVQIYGERPEKTSWTATVGISVVDKVTASTQIIDPGIRVISYQSAKDST